MCGIAGVWGEEGATCDDRMRDCLNALRHRGPDDQGLVRLRDKGRELVLGQTRLAVIDLTAGGHQPMASADERYALVFNGEIYNYRELRQELVAEGARFTSASDTEVLLMAWQRWGRGCLPRLRGMFAFAVHDRQAGTLTCVRDPFGIKPLFYSSGRDRFAFASEAPALVDLLGETVDVNHRSAFRYLELGYYDESDETFFNGILKLRPGHLIVVGAGSDVIQERWWWPSIEERSDLSFDDAAELLRELILDSVRLHLRSDVPLGSALSGGIDSSVIVGAVRHVAPDAEMHTFSYIAGEGALSEEAWVDLVNGAVGAVPHKVSATSEEMLRDLGDLIRIQGEPFASTSIYAQYRVFQAAREAGVTVTLDGQGADELLGGYAGYPVQRLRSLLSRGRVAEALQFGRAWSSWPGRNASSLRRGVLGQLVPYSARDAVRVRSASREWIRPPTGLGLTRPGERSAAPPRGRHLVSALRAGITERGLEGLLRHADRNAMAFSVESRVPFLTPDIAELTLRLPEHFLVSPDGNTKHLLRAAMRGIVPSEVLSRRDKVGFETPQRNWLLNLGDEIDDWVEPARYYPFLDVDVVRAGLRQWRGSEVAGPGGDAVWRLLNFCGWLDVMGPRLCQ